MARKRGDPRTEKIRLRLEAARTRLFEAIRGLTEEQMRRRPEPGRWCVAEVMAHLPTWERKLLREAASLRRTPGASVTLPSEAEQEQAASRGRRLPPPGIVHDLVGARWETLTFLTGLTAQDLDRGGRDRGGMDLTVARILIIIAEHEDEQAARIERLRAELGLPTGQPAPRQAGLPVTQV